MPTTTEQNKAFLGYFSQAEVNYVPLSSQIGVKACANCRFFMNNGCFIVNDYPEPVIATGMCDRWETGIANTMPDFSNPLPVMIVTEDMLTEEMALPTTGKGLVDTIVKVVKNLLKPAPVPIPDAPLKEDAFIVSKGIDGKHYWLARHTGKFKDREGEIIADKAHEEYVDRVQKGLVPMPELWTRHLQGTKHGQADLVWKTDGFVMAFGHFDDTAEAKQAIGFYEKNAGNITLSHMFHYPTNSKLKGVYYAYNTIEITTLDVGEEAFPYTSFEGFKMATLTEKDIKWVRELGGDEMAERVIAFNAKAPPDTKALEALGVESKGLDNFEGATIPAQKSELDAVKAVQSDIETRLKAVETNTPAQIKAQNDTIAALKDQVTASQQAETAALAKYNTLEKDFLEYKALKPPASQSNDTVLNEREKTLIDNVMSQAKVDNQPSLVDKMVGGQPTAVTGV